MAGSTDDEYPPSLMEAQLEYLLSNVQDWSIANGLAVRPPPALVSESPDRSQSLAITAPVTLFPSTFPRSCFIEARELQCSYNALYAVISQCELWLGRIVKELVDVDDFIAGLWNVHLAVEKEGYVQDISMGIFRSDYMIHDEDELDPTRSFVLRQVEFNTIASSFGGLSTKVSSLHRYLRQISAYPPQLAAMTCDSALPENDTAEAISHGLYTAHKAYGRSRTVPSTPLCLLFVVQDHENNIFDQEAVSLILECKYGIPVFRLPFSATLTQTSFPVDNVDRPLMYHPPHQSAIQYEVTTIYFRAGYSPSEYPSATAWDARIQLERSAAIKCPSVLTHLAGSKKIQQMLAVPSSTSLEDFMSQTRYFESVDAMRATWTAMYPMDDSSDGLKAIEMARHEEMSKNFVLKPQREGGGNNIYGANIPPFLKSLGSDINKYKSYVLMELIEPPSVRNTILRNGQVQSGEVIGELGIYGVCLWRTAADPKSFGEVFVNKEAGFLLRTKGRDSEEGGVAAGFGAIDSPLLTDK